MVTSGMGRGRRSGGRRRAGVVAALVAVVAMLAGVTATAPGSAAPKSAANGPATTTAPVRYDDLPDPPSGTSRYVQVGTKWAKTNLTYRFVTTTADLTVDAQKIAVRTAFNVWQNQIPLTFTEVTSGADIDIEFATGAHGDANPFDGVGGVLAHAYFPPSDGLSSGIYGDLHFDDAETWTVNLRGGGAQPIDLVSVAVHELGHSLGLGHSSDTTAVMYAYYGGSRRSLTSDDVAGIQSLYGARSGTNTAPTASTTFGGLSGVANTTFRLSVLALQVANDAEADPLFFSPSSGSNALGSWACGDPAVGTDQCWFAPWAYATGSASFPATVADGRGGTVGVSIPVTVTANDCVTTSESCAIQWASPGDLPVPADYNSDGRTDLGIWRPSTGTWYVRGIYDNGVRFGLSSDLPRPGDYNGDGKVDFAVYRPSTATWYFDTNQDGAADQSTVFGAPGDLPCTAHFTGAGNAIQLCVFRPSNGTWYISTANNGVADLVVPYASPGDQPAAGNYDGDSQNTTDLAVFRSSNGTWYVKDIWDSGRKYASPGDVPGPADYTGDGTMDVTVFRPANGTWYVRNSAWPWPTS